MKRGRPRKAGFAPVYSAKHNRWVIDIPASVGGTRQRRFFQSQSEALEAAATISKSVEDGTGIVIPSHQGNVTPDISSLVHGYLLSREGKTGAGNHKVLSWGLAFLVEKFGRLKPNELTSQKTAPWIASLKMETRSRFNVFCAGRTFFSSPLVRDMVTKNPFRDAPPKSDKGHRLDILTPDQMRIILALDLKAPFKAWLVAGGFAGIRSVEFSRISYGSIDYEHMEIVIRKEESKQGEAARPRSITIEDAFKRHMPTGEGLLSGDLPRYLVKDEMNKALKALDLKEWPKNCLRHSFASYHLAQSRDAGKTAYEMGHTSPTLLYSTYANAVSRKDAADWWAL